MEKMTNEKMERNRHRMFEQLHIDKTFEPFIGKTYIQDKQKHILFVSYDEWSYMRDALKKYAPKKNGKTGPILKDDSTEMNIRQLFRSSPYYKHIDGVLKGINSGLTSEDVAFHNFVVRPVDWVDHSKYRNDKEAYFIEESTKAFRAVVDFCRPDMVIFCSQSDYHQINSALNSTLNSFLRERGIEYLESGNLNYDMDPDVKEIDNTLIPTANPLRALNRYADFPSCIKDHPDYKKSWDYDRINLDLQQIKYDSEHKYRNIPDELQKLAAFIDNEIKSTGSFIHHRMLQVLKNLERTMQNEYAELMFQHIEDHNEDKFFSDILCTEIKPQMYKSLHMLKAITLEFERAFVDQSIRRCHSYCTYSPGTKRNSLMNRHEKDRETAKQDLIKEGVDPEDEEKLKITTKRWNEIKRQNSYAFSKSEFRRKEDLDFKEKYNSLLEKELDGKKLTKAEQKFLNDEFGRFISLPQQNEYENFEKTAKTIKSKIINTIRKDRNISLEALSKAFFIDEYYLAKFLEKEYITLDNGRWEGKTLDKGV